MPERNLTDELKTRTRMMCETVSKIVKNGLSEEEKKKCISTFKTCIKTLEAL